MPDREMPANAPYENSQVICDFHIDWSTYQRLAPGSDNWPVTWAADNHQYTSWGDGGGFGGTNQRGRVSLGVARIDGTFDKFKGHNLWGGFDTTNKPTFGGKSYGIYAVGEDLYMWVSPGSNAQGYEEARIFYSPNKGATWKPSTWAFSLKEGIVFPTFLQGDPQSECQNNQYIYVYAINLKHSKTLSIQKPGEIILMRVSCPELMNRAGYEFFAGIDKNGKAIWTSDILKRMPAFTNPAGVGWNCAVSYHRFLKRYLLTTEHTRSFHGNFSLFEGPTPWGPWKTVKYVENFGAPHVTPTSFYWNFSLKWSSSKGSDTSLIFTGIDSLDSFNAVKGTFLRNCPQQ